MKKLVAVLFLSAALAVALMILAFFYIDISGHKGFYYEVFLRDSLFGGVKVDRYATESKVVYKARAEFPFSYGYPSSTERLFLDKSSKLPIKYTQESVGARGQKILKVLSQKGEYSDYLFLENPFFIRLEGFSTGEKTMVYSPDDVMLLMALMERYNYWKKGTQFFEVMVPLDAPVPPVRDKVGVEYVDDEYIPVMGSRVEAQSFRVKSKGLPEVKVLISKYSRRVLIMEIPERSMKFVLVTAEEGPADKIQGILRNLPFVPASLKKVPGEVGEEFPSGQTPRLGKISEEKVRIEGYISPKEVFFESGKLILSGSMWMPEGKGPFVPVLIIPNDGPRKGGERLLTDYMGSFLAGSGYIALKFDSPGQGKSQGSFHEMDDEAKVNDIKAALKYVNGLEASRKSATVIVTHGNSAYTGVNAAGLDDSVNSCVLLSPRSEGAADGPDGKGAAEIMKRAIREAGLGVFDETFLETAGERAERHIKSVSGSREDAVYFMGIKLPIKEYRAYLQRKTYQAISGLRKPVLIISGRDDGNPDVRALEGLVAVLKGNNDKSRVDIFKTVGPYAGDIKKIDDRWEYIPQKQVFEAIKAWIEKRRQELPEIKEVNSGGDRE